MEEQVRNHEFFKRDLTWFCRKFNIRHPLTVDAPPKLELAPA
jgi:hypothetical protein